MNVSVQVAATPGAIPALEHMPVSTSAYPSADGFEAETSKPALAARWTRVPPAFPENELGLTAVPGDRHGPVQGDAGPPSTTTYTRTEGWRSFSTTVQVSFPPPTGRPPRALSQSLDSVVV